ncbi:MAG TPA: cytidylate kinase-like family protein [Thermomicrobiaceae bacterium]|nr:cytidylate kinase-like family protein [Thermomicrobiaceae bacterium]
MPDPSAVPAHGDMSAVTISRQYGCGGGEIAKRLAGRLSWTLIDHQIVANVAEQLGISPDEARARDEHGASFVSRVLDALLTTTPEVPVTPDSMPSTPGAIYHEAVSRVIEEALRTRHVVIVGRGGQALLQDRRDVLHVRVVAPLAQRVAYVTQREGLSAAEARARIHSREQDRARYLQAHYRRGPDDALLYDLTINTQVISLDGAVDLLLLALEQKASRLGLPESALGPGAGLERYRGEPGNIMPPVAPESANR